MTYTYSVFDVYGKRLEDLKIPKGYRLKDFRPAQLDDIVFTGENAPVTVITAPYIEPIFFTGPELILEKV